MIVPTYTEEQVTHEVETEMRDFLVPLSDKKQPKHDKKVQKASSFPVYSYCFATSPLHNRWLVQFTSRGKKEVGDDSIVSFILMTTDGIGARGAIELQFRGEDIYLIFFTPHFFSRYGERMGLSCHGEELVRRYFILNSNVAVAEIYGTTHDGVALGVRNTREENKAIKEGRGSELWNDKPHKKSHKDVDARWTEKRGEKFYGYKMHYQSRW